jgi:hypothetical protein
MATGDVPTITQSAIANTVYGGDDIAAGNWVAPPARKRSPAVKRGVFRGLNTLESEPDPASDHWENQVRANVRRNFEKIVMDEETLEPVWDSKPEDEDEMANQRRVVQVFISDPDDNVPIEKCMLYQGTVKLTDATDQELFFEVPIQELLSKHNEIRTALPNKKIKGRVEMLEPIRVRDLSMVVALIAKL